MTQTIILIVLILALFYAAYLLTHKLLNKTYPTPFKNWQLVSFVVIDAIIIFFLAR